MILEKENKELRAKIDWGDERAEEAARRAALVKQQRETKRMNLKLEAETRDKVARRRQTEVKSVWCFVVCLCVLGSAIKNVLLASLKRVSIRVAPCCLVRWESHSRACVCVCGRVLL